jgi:hypothetical protein
MILKKNSILTTMEGAAELGNMFSCRNKQMLVNIDGHA